MKIYPWPWWLSMLEQKEGTWREEKRNQSLLTSAQFAKVGGSPVPLVPQLFYPQAHTLPEETTHTSSSSFTTLAWALLRAWSRISMCRLWSSLVERAVASSASSFSFSRWLSLSIRTWNINTAIPELAQNLTWAKLTIIPITRRSKCSHTQPQEPGHQDLDSYHWLYH